MNKDIYSHLQESYRRGSLIRDSIASYLVRIHKRRLGTVSVSLDSKVNERMAEVVVEKELSVA